MGGHYVAEKTETSFAHFRSMVVLITKYRKEIIMKLMYLIKLIKLKQNMGIK